MGKKHRTFLISAPKKLELEHVATLDKRVGLKGAKRPLHAERVSQFELAFADMGTLQFIRERKQKNWYCHRAHVLACLYTIITSHSGANSRTAWQILLIYKRKSGLSGPFTAGKPRGVPAHKISTFQPKSSTRNK